MLYFFMKLLVQRDPSWEVPVKIAPFWGQFAGELIPRSPIRFITKNLVHLPQNIANIIMARHFIPLRERIFGGFEHYFKRKIWKATIQLESPEFVVSALLDNPGHLGGLWVFKKWNKIHQYATDESTKSILC